MSHTPFLESQSADPVEQAIARKVMRILNDTALDRAQREDLVKKAQRELVRHRAQKQAREAVQAQAAKASLPKGYQARCITVRDGVVHIGAADRRTGFVWLEAGAAPKGVAANQPVMSVDRPGQGRQPGTPRVRKDPIAERRKGLAPASVQATGSIATPRNPVRD